jgi:hypothetical protein
VTNPRDHCGARVPERHEHVRAEQDHESDNEDDQSHIFLPLMGK